MTVATAIPARPVIRDFLRYAASGCGAAAADFTTFSLLAYAGGFSPESANLISRPIGGLVSFFLHKYFTFENRGVEAARVQFGRFWVVWAVSFGVSQTMVWFYHTVVHFGPMLAKISAEGAAGVVAFLCQRHWTFR